MLGLLAALGVREAVTAARSTRRSAFAKSLRGAVGSEVGAAAAGRRAVGAARRLSRRSSESAAIAALYALIVQRFIHRDLPTFKDVVRVAGDCVALVGGVLVILSVAVGPDQLSGQRAGPDAADRVDAGAHRSQRLAVPARR